MRTMALVLVTWFLHTLFSMHNKKTSLSADYGLGAGDMVLAHVI